MLLKDKIALITGASQGIGKETALIFAKQGAKVIVNYIGNKEMAESVVSKIKEIGSEAIAIEADVSDFESCKKMVGDIKEKYGKLDIVVNNAGITKDRTIKKMTTEEWSKVININLTGVFNVTKNALQILSEGGSIVSVSSVVGLCGNFGQGNYAASKAGIIGLTKTLAKELGKKKIRANAVAPGFIQTPMTKDLPFLRKKVIENIIPMKEFGKPTDVANAILFLASDLSTYVTGNVLRVDGGLNF